MSNSRSFPPVAFVGACMMLAVFMAIMDTIARMKETDSASVSDEEIIAWRCTAVTDQNWRDASWANDSNLRLLTSIEICQSWLINSTESPCLYGNLPYLCRGNGNDLYLRRGPSLLVDLILSSEQQDQAADALVILHPTIPDPRSE